MAEQKSPTRNTDGDAFRAAVRSKAIDTIRPTKRSIATFGIGAVLLFVVIYTATTNQYFDTAGVMLAQLGGNAAAFAIGVALGVAPLLLLGPYRDLVIAGIGLFILAWVLIPGVGAAFFLISGGYGLSLGALYLAWRLYRPINTPQPTTFGSSRWANRQDLLERQVLGHQDGIFLGEFESEDLTYRGKDANRHLLTVAPTRAGKGQCAIIPNLLMYEGSALVIDPKGENAQWTAAVRHREGQAVHIVDPWNITGGDHAARINPLDMLKPGDPDLVSDIALLADALVPQRQGENDPFFTNQARAFVSAFILYLVLSKEEDGTRTLGRLRDILSLPVIAEGETADPDDDTFDGILLRMFQLDGANGAAAKSAASRIVAMPEKTRASVLSSAHEATAWLDSPAIRNNLSATDVDFDQFKKTTMTVYLVLPVDRLTTFGPWLRIHIAMALQRIVRDPTKPEKPVLFILDEFAAVGRLKIIEDAFAIMAGAGVQLWAIVQDFSQLKGLYANTWQTFIANAGVIQYFGSRDLETAEYISKMCGSATVTNIAQSIAKAFSRSTGASSSSSKSETETSSTSLTGRPIMMPDELMRIPRDRQILLVGDCFPIAAKKVYAYNDPGLMELINAPTAKS